MALQLVVISSLRRAIPLLGLSLGLTLVLGFGLPAALRLLARLCGLEEGSAAAGIVLLYGCLVLCVARPPLPRGSLPDKNGDGAAELERLNSDRMKVLQLNVCSEEEVAKALEFVTKNLKEPDGGIWGVVNNAGITTFGEVEFMTVDKYKEVADVNLWGTVRVTKAFLPLIRRAKGRVVNMASMLGRMTVPSRSCYCISKYGVEAFSDCLRQEMYQWGVKVIVIEPTNFIAATGILTREGVEARADEMWTEASKIVREDYGKSYFSRRMILMKSFVNSGIKDMSLVVNDITDALNSKFPYTRYNPSDTYWWVRIQIMTHLPAAIADRLYLY